ncbi:MAG: hypothetical protein H6661_02615 [Ardenticatenaceae bacterium]|nr:hypothetical protein [Ardenticatenaceae bacterium]
MRPCCWPWPDEAPDAPSELHAQQLADLRAAWRGVLRDQGRVDGRFLALEEDLTQRRGGAEEHVAVLRDMRRHDYWLDMGAPAAVQAIHRPLAFRR